MTGAVPDPLPDWLAQARRIVVLTGTGISTESGIPDYRGPDGVWTKDPDAEKLVTLSYYVGDPEIRRRAWLMRRDHAFGDIAPNAGHRALADLERQGRLRALLTQNIDGLHQQFMAIGTSLGVHPAAGLTDIAAGSGARVVIVNAEPTPYDWTADLVVREPIGTALPRLLGAAHQHS